MFGFKNKEPSTDSKSAIEAELAELRKEYDALVSKYKIQEESIEAANKRIGNLESSVEELNKFISFED